MSEPKAWMTENGTIFDELPLISGGLIPLYTHPMRELTDGEILNIYLEQTNGNKDLDILEFARAILMKASEK
jgi:hypothetical protein